jgi:hypothetical protein
MERGNPPHRRLIRRKHNQSYHPCSTFEWCNIPWSHPRNLRNSHRTAEGRTPATGPADEPLAVLVFVGRPRLEGIPLMPQEDMQPTASMAGSYLHATVEAPAGRTCPKMQDLAKQNGCIGPFQQYHETESAELDETARCPQRASKEWLADSNPQTAAASRASGGSTRATSVCTHYRCSMKSYVLNQRSRTLKIVTQPKSGTSGWVPQYSVTDQTLFRKYAMKIRSEDDIALEVSTLSARKPAWARTNEF